MRLCKHELNFNLSLGTCIFHHLYYRHNCRQIVVHTRHALNRTNMFLHLQLRHMRFIKYKVLMALLAYCRFYNTIPRSQTP